jgi:hypothetical protein
MIEGYFFQTSPRAKKYQSAEEHAVVVGIIFEKSPSVGTKCASSTATNFTRLLSPKCSITFFHGGCFSPIFGGSRAYGEVIISNDASMWRFFHQLPHLCRKMSPNSQHHHHQNGHSVQLRKHGRRHTRQPCFFHPLSSVSNIDLEVCPFAHTMPVVK